MQSYSDHYMISDYDAPGWTPGLLPTPTLAERKVQKSVQSSMNIQNVPLLNAMSRKCIARIHGVPVSTTSPLWPVLLRLSSWSTQLGVFYSHLILMSVTVHLPADTQFIASQMFCHFCITFFSLFDSTSISLLPKCH